MSLGRIVAVLLSALLVMLAAVLLRVETTRLHYRTSLCDQRYEEHRHELRSLQLRLARLRDPSAIRARIMNLRVPEIKPSGETAERPGRRR